MVTVKKNNEIKIFSNEDDLFQMAAKNFTQRAIDSVNAKGVFTVVLSGGNTPKSLFAVLSGNESYIKQIPWDRIQFFFSDERYVSTDDDENNFHMAYEYLFSKVPLPSKNIYRIPTQYSDPKDAAIEYELTLRKTFCVANDEFPQFDLLYLGLGEDGHTASLMPFSEVAEAYSKPNIDSEKKYQLVASLWVPLLKMYRITLTPPAINNALSVVFLVTGANKASAVSAVLEGPYDPQRYPGQLINCVNGKTIWYLEHAAARKLINSH